MHRPHGARNGSRANPLSRAQPIAPSAGVTPIPTSRSARARALKIRLKGKWLKEEYTRHPEPREITVEEMQQLIGEAARNAKLAVLSGFEDVEPLVCQHYRRSRGCVRRR